MKKLILHLGVHKTATTYLQEVLQYNQQSLLTKQIKYIDLATMRREITPKIVNAEVSFQQLKKALNKYYDNETIIIGSNQAPPIA